jgi:hypothetical protein
MVNYKIKDIILIKLYRVIANIYFKHAVKYVNSDYLKYKRLVKKCNKYEFKANFIIFKY